MLGKRLSWPCTLIMLTGLVLSAAAAQAQSDDSGLRGEFEQAYTRYEAALAASDFGAAVPAAAEALELGLQIFGEYHLNTASLRQNNALMLELQGVPGEAVAEYGRALEILESLELAESLTAVPILTRLAGLYAGGPEPLEYLQRAIRIQRTEAPDDLLTYAGLAVEAVDILARDPQNLSVAGEFMRPLVQEVETVYGEDSPELVSVLIALGKADSRSGDDLEHVRHARRAMAIAEDAFEGNPQALGNVALALGRDLLLLSRSANSEAFLEDAYDYYEGSLGAEDPRTAEAAMLLGQLRYSTRDFSRAEEPLLAALQVFTGNGQFQGEEVRIRTMLAELYVIDGKTDEAMPHLIELNGLTVFSEEQEFLPVLKPAPIYPPRAARRAMEGYVIVEYTVTPTGETRDVFVVESTHSLFEQPSIDSAQRYRYIPRVVDGEAVEVPNIRTKIEYVLFD